MELGVCYTCKDSLFKKIPTLMSRAGIELKELPTSEVGQGCEHSLALQMSRDKGTVNLVGYHISEENRYFMIFNWGRNPFRWIHDEKLSEAI